MKKKIFNWFFVNILLPFFKDILIELTKFLSKYVLDLLKEKMESWKKADENNAKTEEEKIIIRKKWEDRMEDIENIKTKMDQNIDKIVHNALENSQEKMKEFYIIEDKDSKLIS